jgi:REP element-mobilizing transposase RayT
MKYDSDIHHRHSIRLKGFDYSSNGKYYITICTQDKKHLFGEVVVASLFVPAQMNLNIAGKMIDVIWNETLNSNPTIVVDKYVIMPNHLHCILTIPNTSVESTKISVSEILQAFKSKTTVEYIRGVKSGIFPPFDKRLWQRNYYEHIIRDEDDYNTKWNYIEQNPAKWAEDEYYTASSS